MKTASIAAFALFTLAAASGCSATTQSAQPTVADRECSAPGALVVSPPTAQRGFDPDLADSTVHTVGTAQLEGRGVRADTSRGLPVRTTADTSARGGPRYCF